MTFFLQKKQNLEKSNFLGAGRGVGVGDWRWGGGGVWEERGLE